MAAVPGLLLVLGFRRPGCAWGLPGAWGHVAPVALAVLVDEAHFGLGQQLGQLLVRGCGETGAGGRWGARRWRWEEGSVDGVPAQDVQLHPRDDMLEVVLGGRAGVEATVPGLQGAEQQALLCAQEAVLGTNLQEQGAGAQSCVTSLPPSRPPEQTTSVAIPWKGPSCGIST